MSTPMQPWPVCAQTRLLVIAPHPDDETLGCGILLQQVRAAGGDVRIVLMTDGDNNPWPQRFLERRVRIDHAARQRWGARRRDEVMRALEQLDIAATALAPLGWHDMEVTARLRDDFAGSVAAIRAQIEAFRPTIVCAPAIQDSHPDHGAAHVLCRLALASVRCPITLLTYPVHGGAHASAYPWAAAATPEQTHRKLRALNAYGTQMALSGRRMRRLGLSPERYMQVVAGDGSGRLPWRPPAPLRRWLRLLVVTPAGVWDESWSRSPLVRDPDGASRLQVSEAGPVFVKLHLDWPSPWIFDHWGWCEL